MGTPRFASGYNGYMPQATGQVIAYVRKEDQFAMNRYVQYVPTPAKLGYYVQAERDAFVRVKGASNSVWEGGASRKQMGRDNKIRWENIPFRTQRRNWAWELDWQAISQVKDFKIKPAHMDMAISQCMTERTLRIKTLLQTAANWGSNTSTANTLNGGKGKWLTASDDPQSANYNAIHLTLANAAQKIHLLTNGRVKPTDLRIILSPGAAIKTAATAEISNYCRESSVSKQLLEEGFDPQYEQWGLPRRYKGFEFVVEDAPVVQEFQKADGTQATTNRTYIWDDTSAVMASRVGGIDGEYGSQNFSTLQFYHYEGLAKVAAFDDAEDELTRGHVSEDTKEVLIPTSGWLITSIF